MIMRKCFKEKIRKNGKVFSSITLKPINIRWIETGSQQHGKFMYSIVLLTIFHEYSIIKLIPVIFVSMGFQKSDLTKMVLISF